MSNCAVRDPEHWQDWKQYCLLTCDSVSRCAIFAKGHDLAESKRKAIEAEIKTELPDELLE